MECGKIRELLSEYIDDILDDPKKALVEDHLSTCRVCKEELASLRAVVNELSSLESVEAPGDFLEKLHERMESRVTFAKVMRMLFVPIRIKIPLEFATAAAVAILILTLWHTHQPGKQIVDMPKGSKPVGIAKRTEMAQEFKPAFGEATVPPSEKERGAIQLALLVKPEPTGTAHAPSPVGEPTPVPEERAKRTQGKAIRIASSERARPAEGTAPIAEKKADELKEEDRPKGFPMREGPVSKDEALLSIPFLEETLANVRDLVVLEGGKVVSLEYEKQTGRPESINIEIPAKHYHSFCEELKRLAVLQVPPPTMSERDQEVVHIRIRFISSE